MINFDWQQTGNNNADGSEKKLKRSTMLSIIALTTLTSMTVTGCAQTVSQTNDKEKEKEETTSNGHGYHGGHGAHGTYAGSSSAASRARSKEYGRTKAGRTVTVKASSYQAPPANAWGGVTRGWFGRFCGSVFGG